MECAIVAGNVRTFGKAIHSMAKIGIDLYIEALNEGLAIRTVNLSRSAYASVTFRRDFFQSYDNGMFPGENETIKCVVDMKACFAIFKSLTAIEKSVHRCTLRMDMYSNKLKIKLFCTHDIMQSYELVSIESDPMLAVFSKTDCCNYIASFPKILANVFQSFQEEVTLTTTSNVITLENYVEETQAPTKVMHTKLHMEPDEFQVYNIQRETNVTFSSKELKAALSFSEITDQPISIHFDGPGKPIVIAVSIPNHIEADFVLATLDSAVPVEDSPSSQTITTTPEYSIIRKANENCRRIREETAQAPAEVTVVHQTPVAEISNGAHRESERRPSNSAVITTVPVEQPQQSIITPTENHFDASPPHKRTRSVFMAASPSMLNNDEVVLACDTDYDDDEGAFEDN